MRVFQGLSFSSRLKNSYKTSRVRQCVLEILKQGCSDILKLSQRQQKLVTSSCRVSLNWSSTTTT